MPPIFWIDLCPAAKFKREETELPHLILHNGKGSGRSPGRQEMSVPNSFGPKPSSRISTKELRQQWKRPVLKDGTHLFSEPGCQSVRCQEHRLLQAVCKHLLLPSFSKHIAAQHRVTDSRFEGVPLHIKCLRISSRSADDLTPKHLFVTVMLKSDLQ